jgi:hypothetical protein
MAIVKWAIRNCRTSGHARRVAATVVAIHVGAARVCRLVCSFAIRPRADGAFDGPHDRRHIEHLTETPRTA